MNILMRDRAEGRLTNERASRLIYLLLSCVDIKEKVTFDMKILCSFKLINVRLRLLKKGGDQDFLFLMHNTCI